MKVMNKKSYVILLDGPKGSWKSSISLALKNKISDSIFLSLDLIRRGMNLKATNENNKTAYESLLKQAKQSIEEWKNVIIDCGMIEEKLKALEVVTKNIDINIYKYFLEAPYDTLLQRVKDRDIKEWKATDEGRFKYTYEMIKSKQLINYTTFDTSKLSTEEIANQIIENLT